MRSARSAFKALTVAAIAVALAACGSGATPSPAGNMRAEGAWARQSMGMDLAVAFYVTLTNETGTADALVGATSPAAATVEVHETSADASGQMAMHPVGKIALPVGGRVELAPGGYHVMLIGLTKELKAGDKVEVTLEFETAPDLVVSGEVRAN